MYGISFNMYCLISSSEQSYEALCVSNVSAQYLSVTDQKRTPPNKKKHPLFQGLYIVWFGKYE